MGNKVLASVVFAAALLVGAAVPFGGAQAVTIIINGSFESGITPGSFTTVNAVNNTSITGWSVDTGSVDYIGSYWQAADGGRSIDMSGNGPGSISQLLSGLDIGQYYTVTFDLAGNPDGGQSTKQLTVAAIGSQDYFFTVTGGDSKTNMGWVSESFTFLATSGSALLSFKSDVTSPYGPALDNVAIFATPLPAALPLFASGLGAMGLLGWRRKRKKGIALARA